MSKIILKKFAFDRAEVQLLLDCINEEIEHGNVQHYVYDVTGHIRCLLALHDQLSGKFERPEYNLRDYDENPSTTTIRTKTRPAKANDKDKGPDEEAKVRQS